MSRTRNGFRAALARMSGGNSKIAKPTVRPENQGTTVLIRDHLLEGLRVNDATVNAIAAELLVRQGEYPVPHLALAATNQKNSPKHRVRVLNTLRRIGVVSDPAALTDLFC